MLKARQLQQAIGTDQQDDMNGYAAALKATGMSLSTVEKKQITTAVSWKNPDAEKVIKKAINSDNQPSLKDLATTADIKLKAEENLSQVYIVDESSMVGDKKSAQGEMNFGTGRLLSDLSLQIGILRKNVNTKILFVGDYAQLPPIMEKISPALLVLSDAGQMGVRTINADNIVEFNPVDILRDEADGIWVTGLSAVAKVIVVGQQLVVAGEKVDSTHEPINLVGGAKESEHPAL